MLRIVYLSQMVAPDAPLRDLLPRESSFVVPLFAGLGAQVHVVDVTVEPPPCAEGWDGVVVGGTAGSVNDTEPWRLRLRRWMSEPLNVPFLGICGGHQLLAQCLGARILPLPARRHGVYPLHVPGIRGFTDRVVQMHGEYVADVPTGADVWAHDGVCIQALRYPGHKWTVQFHPEASVEALREAARKANRPAETWPDGEVDLAVAGGKALISSWLDGIRSR